MERFSGLTDLFLIIVPQQLPLVWLCELLVTAMVSKITLVRANQLECILKISGGHLIRNDEHEFSMTQGILLSQDYGNL